MDYAQFSKILMFSNFFPGNGKFFPDPENRVPLTSLIQGVVCVDA